MGVSEVPPTLVVGFCFRFEIDFDRISYSWLRRLLGAAEGAFAMSQRGGRVRPWVQLFVPLLQSVCPS